MRKGSSWLLILVLLLSLCAAALAADSTTEYGLDSVSGKLAISDKYTVLTPSNLTSRAGFLSARGLSPDALLADWETRGVVLQAWSEEQDACLEVRLLQDEDAAAYFDTDQQTAQARASYRSSHLKSAAYSNQGYSIKSAEWKKQTLGGRFLRLKYKRTVGGETYWGYAAKAVRNGWTLVLDYQVYGRGLKAKDETALNKIANTVSFQSTLSMPATVAGLVEYTAVPPSETNTGAFTVEGICPPKAHLIGVVMRYSSPTPIRVEGDASAAGKFKLKVQLPQEGIWLMTLTVELNGATVAEEVFNTTTYQATLLPLNLDAEVPSRFETDEYVLTGTTSKAVSVQCIVSGGAKNFDKTVRTNGTGRFTFKIPTSAQSEYTITLILQKKNYETRRFTWTANRDLTEADLRNQLKEQAVKPAYATLKSKLDSYTGKVMGYKVYPTQIQQSGDEWLVYAALTRTTRGTLKDLIVITTSEEPDLTLETAVRMYGTCVGAYEVQSEEDTVSYPCFDLLFWEPLT